MSRERGFTLIELMIVVVVIGILASIALPAYGNYVRRARIAEMVSEMASFRTKAEQHFQDRRGYVGVCGANSLARLPQSTASFVYTCTPEATETTYTLVATGQKSLLGFVYTLSQNNVRHTTTGAGWAGNGSNCWVLKQDGSC